MPYRRVGKSILCVVLLSCLLFGAVQQSGAACIPPPGGIVAWWPGDGNAKDIVAGKNGTVTGAVSYATSKVGKGFNFAGGYGIVAGVKVNKSSLLNVKDAITIEAWIKPSSAQLLGPIFEWRQTNPAYAGTPFGVHFWEGADGYNDNQLFINVRDTNGSYNIMQVPGVLTPGVWQHVAMTYENCSGNASLYVSGNLVGTQYLGLFDMMTDDYLYIGYRPQTPSDGWYSFNGGIDEVSLYSRALSDAEIKAISDAGASGKCKTNP